MHEAVRRALERETRRAAARWLVRMLGAIASTAPCRRVAKPHRWCRFLRPRTFSRVVPAVKRRATSEAATSSTLSPAPNPGTCAPGPGFGDPEHAHDVLLPAAGK